MLIKVAAVERGSVGYISLAADWRFASRVWLCGPSFSSNRKLSSSGQDSRGAVADELALQI